MASSTTLTRNLKLRINSNLTADAKYNLERLDLLGSTFLVDSTNTLKIRSITDILLEPESPDVGGSGVNGVLSIGTANHSLSAINLYAQTIQLNSPISLLDQASGGSKYLQLQYKSDINGLVDTAANRVVSIDLDGANRSLVFGGDLSVLGGSIVLNTSVGSNVIVPLSGTLSTLAGLETLTNKTIDASANTITNITNSSVSSSAGISYSKLNLSGSIQNSDVSPSAAISYSKLSLGNSILNADINATAAIDYSKLHLTTSIVDGDIAPGAAIQYGKLFLNGSVTNADLSPTAAIARSKIATGTPNHVLINDGSGNFSHTNVLPISMGGTGSATPNGALSGLLPLQTGNSGKFLATDGMNTYWGTPSGGGGGGTVVHFEDNWITTDGASKVVTHNLSSTSVEVTIIDLDDSSILMVDSIVASSANSITLSASESPANNWKVVIHASV